jgi:hypothetical protein
VSHLSISKDIRSAHPMAQTMQVKRVLAFNLTPALGVVRVPLRTLLAGELWRSGFADGKVLVGRIPWDGEIRAKDIS